MVYRDRMILNEVESGDSLADVAAAYGISTARAQQIVSKEKRKRAINAMYDSGDALIMPNRAFFAVIETSGKPRDEINMGDVRESANFLMSHKAHRIGKVTTKSIADFIKANSSAGHAIRVVNRGAT